MNKLAAAVLVAFVTAAGCRSESKQKPLDVNGQKLYTLNGTIVSRDPGENTVRLDHEAVPGFMEAMIMDYSVRGARVGTLPADGTRVAATLHIADDAYWLTNVKKAR